MLLKYIGCALVMGCFLISIYFYNHKNRDYVIGKKKKIKSNPTFFYLYRYLQFSTALFSLAGLLTDWPFLLKFHNKTFLSLIGFLFILVGISLFVIAKRTLGKEYSPCFDSYAPQHIISGGVYKYIRHPIYTSNLLLVFGFFLTSSSLLILFNLLIMILYYAKAASNEEKALQEEFPEYTQYITNSGKFFPRLLSSKYVK